jgi:hypothetical protein
VRTSACSDFKGIGLTTEAQRAQRKKETPIANRQFFIQLLLCELCVSVVIFSGNRTGLRNKKAAAPLLGTCGSLLLNCAKKNARRGCAGKRPRSRRRLFSSSAASGHKSQVRSILLRARTRYKQDPVRNPAFFDTNRNNPAMWSEPES